MKPDLEVVQICQGESFKAWSHGYPFHTVRWHFHPEYEIHLVTETTGRYFVGDFIGEFEPGNLVMTGPNLPHNWVSAVAEGTVIAQRGLVLQFTEEAIRNSMDTFPEIAAFDVVLQKSRWGLLFTQETAELIKPVLLDLIDAQGGRRIARFMEIIDILTRAQGVETLAGASYQPDPSGYMSAAMNKVLAHIAQNLTEPGNEIGLAAIAGLSPAAFSRSFRRHTGMSPVQYVNRLRINLACQLLMSEEGKSVTDICYEVGFNNQSNFNRQFLAQKGMSPSRFRSLLAENSRAAQAA